jgi:hypothetical protein
MYSSYLRTRIDQRYCKVFHVSEQSLTLATYSLDISLSCPLLLHYSPLHCLLVACHCHHWTSFSYQSTHCFSLIIAHVRFWLTVRLVWLDLAVRPKFYTSCISRDIQCMRKGQGLLCFWKMQDARRVVSTGTFSKRMGVHMVSCNVPPCTRRQLMMLLPKTAIQTSIQ